MKKYTLLLFGICFVLMTYAQKSISKGTSVKILEIGEKDSYFEENENFVGKDATASSELTNNGDGYFTGTLKLSSGRACYFTSVKVKTAATNSTSSTKTTSKEPSSNIDNKPSNTPSALTTKAISKGDKFKVIEVPSVDAYYSSRSEIEGQTGIASENLTPDESGYVGGSIKLDNGKSYYFYKVKLSVLSSGNSTLKTNTPKFITGTITKGTSVYVADLSPDDSYYSNRAAYIGRKGTSSKDDLTMKSDGFYAGNFVFDDGGTAFFYKAKFSKDPVEKVANPIGNTSSSGASTSDSYDDYWGLFDDDKDVKKDYTEWNKATGDATIRSGDKVKVISVSPDDSYYITKDEYVGQEGIASSDLEYKSDKKGYSGSVNLNNGGSAYFYLVKLKKITSFSKSTAPSSTSLSSSSASGSIKKGTRVMVMEIGQDDSFYSNKSDYLRKKGKVAEGLTTQGRDFCSGKIIFEDGTDAYFYKVRVKVLE